MSYMESKMQDQIEGGIALQNSICDDACSIYKQTGIMPLDMKMQRDELLDACVAMIEWDAREKDHAVDFNARMDLCQAAFDKARAAIAKVTGEQK